MAGRPRGGRPAFAHSREREPQFSLTPSAPSHSNVESLSSRVPPQKKSHASLSLLALLLPPSRFRPSTNRRGLSRTGRRTAKAPCGKALVEARRSSSRRLAGVGVAGVGLAPLEGHSACGHVRHVEEPVASVGHKLGAFVNERDGRLLLMRLESGRRRRRRLRGAIGLAELHGEGIIAVVTARARGRGRG